MKVQIILFSIVLIFCFSCRSNNSSDTKAKQEFENKVNYSLQISNRCYFDTVVIWVHPTVIELDSIENSLSKEEAETFEQDAGIYNTDAQSFLIKNVDSRYFVTDSVRIYRFVINGDTVKLNTRNEQAKNAPWRIVLFDGVKKPLLTSPVNVERDYLGYFNKKTP